VWWWRGRGYVLRGERSRSLRGILVLLYGLVRNRSFGQFFERLWPHRLGDCISVVKAEDSKEHASLDSHWNTSIQLAHLLVEFLENLKEELPRVLPEFTVEEPIDNILVALFCGLNTALEVALEGVPGVGNSLLCILLIVSPAS